MLVWWIGFVAENGVFCLIFIFYSLVPCWMVRIFLEMLCLLREFKEVPLHKIPREWLHHQKHSIKKKKKLKLKGDSLYI
jgi:hypothetical protein